ncbi:MAG: ATP-binding protein [Desulfocapsaceae bacterium]|nr:ATP-binding protein [Desulfocapsaceae bacterium]
MSESDNKKQYRSAREKFLGLSLESTRKSYYPQLREQLEAAKDKELHLQLLVDNLPARIAYVSNDERYILVNREYERLFGKPRDEIIGMSIKELIGVTNYVNHRQYREQALNGQDVRFETTFHLPDGGTQIHELSFIPMFNNVDEVDGFYVLGLDVTERRRAAKETKELEAKLFDAQKFKAIGTLAGGIAHDFNNLLMGIQGRASLLGVNLNPSDPLLEHVQAIEEHVRSASDLTKQLLGFARGGKYQVKPVDINELVLNSVKMFGRTRKQIKIHTKLADDNVVAEVDARQIEQVLLNLFVNAWQAMPDGGDLFIETAVVSLAEAFCAPQDMVAGEYVSIEVTDTGVGMAEDVRQRVFDPFFTTKEKQRGTGLGLASAYGIVKNHNGTISVESEPGDGATFRVLLPLSRKKTVREVPAATKFEKGEGHILLVDDEEIILDVGRGMLETLGYKVSLARSGETALEIFDEQQNDIDLVIVDMIMPGMDGAAIFSKIRDIDAEAKVVLSSGYSLDGQAEKIMQRGCSGFIQKPFSIFDISKTIRRVLAS